jgi:5-methylcytosine-specific restriction endonuclease McrA
MSDAVLVLNANFEPVNVCDLRRAITLILAEKATLILNGRGTIKTVSQSFPRPSIIRLNRVIRRPRPVLKLSRREVFRRDNFTCQYCGKRTLDLTIDHILPRHMNGPHSWLNVVTACASCNHRKGGRTLDEANMHLLRPVHEPPASVQYIFGHHLHEYSEWEPYLAGW